MQSDRRNHFSEFFEKFRSKTKTREQRWSRSAFNFLICLVLIIKKLALLNLIKLELLSIILFGRIIRYNIISKQALFFEFIPTAHILTLRIWIYFFLREVSNKTGWDRIVQALTPQKIAYLSTLTLGFGSWYDF